MISSQSPLGRVARHARGNAVAYLALTVALGGTSYAAVNLPAGSVGTRQLRSNAVTSAKVRNRSLGIADLSPNAIAALRGQRGATGATGAAGATGAQGLPGTPGQKGDKGDPGPTYVGHSENVTNGALPGDGVVTDLTGSNGGTGSQPIALPAASRLYVNGSVDLVNTSTTEPIRGRCNAQVSGAGATTLLFDAGPHSFVDLHQADVDSSALGSVVHATVGVTGSIQLDAGTYNVGIVCAATGGGGTLDRFTAAMNLVAVPG